jgi:hypothetical protein
MAREPAGWNLRCNEGTPLLQRVASIAVVALSIAMAAPAKEANSTADVKPAVSGAAEVTLRGGLMCECCTGQGSDKVLVFFAVEGPPEVTRAVDEIVKEFCTGDALDGDQARKTQEAFDKQLKYYVVPGKLDPAKEGRWANPAKALTGVVSEKDGKRWIDVSQAAATKLNYPARMLTPDVPLAMPGKGPLILKVNDALFTAPG